MDDFNPYAAPEAEIAPGKYAPEGGGAWRDGNLLVMSRDAELPDRCIKCNLPAHGYTLKRNLSWHAPWWFHCKTARVFIPLCERHRRRRIRGIIVGWGLFVLGMAVIFGGAALADHFLDRYYHGMFMLADLAVALSIIIIAGVSRARKSRSPRKSTSGSSG